MYTLADKRVMYVPPVVRKKLVKLGIQPREPFTICKAERKEGYRRFSEWQVNKESSSSDLPPSETPSVNGQVNGPGAPTPSNGHAAASPLQQALTASIDAAIAAEQYAAAKGSSVRFGSEDLRAMRSACSSRARAREGYDDLRRRRHDAGGAALYDEADRDFSNSVVNQLSLIS